MMSTAIALTAMAVFGRRFPPPLLAVVVAGALGLSACGSSGPSKASSSSSDTAAHQASTTTTTTTAAAPTSVEVTQVADAVNLRPADLPGYQSSAPDNNGGDDATDEQLDACAGGAPESAQIADVSSDDFTQGSSLPELDISSEVTAERTAADAQTDLAAIKTARARQCIETLFQQDVAQGAGSGVSIGNVTVTPIATSAPGTDGCFGFD